MLSKSCVHVCMRTYSFSARVSFTDLVEVDRAFRCPSGLLEGRQDTIVPVLNELPYSFPCLPLRYVTGRDLERKGLFFPGKNDTLMTGTFGRHGTGGPVYGETPTSVPPPRTSKQTTC